MIFPSRTRIHESTPRLTFVSIFVISWVSTLGCRPAPESNQSIEADVASASRVLSSEVERNIEIFCGDCHRMPNPSSFPQSAWLDEVRRGFDFYYASGRSDMTVPIQADAHQYFVRRAPEKLDLPAPQPIDTSWVDQFDRRDFSIPDNPTPAISFIEVVDLGSPLGRGIVFSDMSAGGIQFAAIQPDGTVANPIQLSQLAHPAAIRVCDWDRDGLQDLMVAELGSFLPGDHDLGKVIWLQQAADKPGKFEAQTLVAGVGRVASIEIADFDRDGNDDLLVAEFGWQTTGSIFWLKRSVSGDPQNGLSKLFLDPRQGSIHVPVADLNGDNAPDFVALISQHYERLELMINDGKGRFRIESIYDAPCPSYGSSGIELVDINGDGKTDILYTNGDSFDSFVLKPFHGVKWFENRGNLSFLAHELGALPGAHRALAGDIDGDGQLEIVAGSLVPQRLLRDQRVNGAEALVVWKRNDQGVFQKHVLANDNCIHAALTLSDLDGDGRRDLIVGHFREREMPGAAISIWYSRLKP